METAPAISDALAFLNRRRLIVDANGNLHVRGEIVALRIINNALVAMVQGRPVPWRIFRQVLQ